VSPVVGSRRTTCWCCRPVRAPDRRPLCRPRIGPPAVEADKPRRSSAPIFRSTARACSCPFASLQSRHSFPSCGAERTRGTRVFSAICSNQGQRVIAPFGAVSPSRTLSLTQPNPRLGTDVKSAPPQWVRRSQKQPDAKRFRSGGKSGNRKSETGLMTMARRGNLSPGVVTLVVSPAPGRRALSAWSHVRANGVQG
jgi:hypothetical protein